MYSTDNDKAAIKNEALVVLVARKDIFMNTKTLLYILKRLVLALLTVWIVITVIGVVIIMCMYVLSLIDKKEYTLLYEEKRK